MVVTAVMNKKMLKFKLEIREMQIKLIMKIILYAQDLKN